MALADDIADDWQFIDGVADVTIETPGGASQSNVKAMRENVKKARAVFGQDAIISPMTTTAFSVWVSTLGDIDIGPDCTLTEADGTAWKVTDGTLMTLDTRWLLLCNKVIT